MRRVNDGALSSGLHTSVVLELIFTVEGKRLRALVVDGRSDVVVPPRSPRPIIPYVEEGEIELKALARPLALAFRELVSMIPLKHKEAK